VRALACLLWACVSLGAPPLAARAARDTDAFQGLASTFQARLASLGQRDDAPPGMLAAFALPDGRVGAAATGWADREAESPMTLDTRSISGSIGKTFVAAVILGLVRERVLELDAKIETWVGDEPWFPRVPNARDITLRMLLNHSSGIPDHVFTWRFRWAIFWKLIIGDGRSGFTPMETLGFVLDREPLFPAGTGYAYTDTGYILLGLIIERASGRSYYELLRERILDPLQLERTIPSNRIRIPELATGYVQPVPHLPHIKTLEDGAFRFNPASEWTGGGLATNPRDLVRWAKALYEGKALRGPYLDALLSRPNRIDEGSSYGLGVYIKDTPLGRALGHGGWFPGYTAAMLYFPERRIALAIQCNKGRGAPIQEFSLALAEFVIDSLDDAAGRRAAGSR
jgi:D-alanyl-D-alanine carboxypeptidase